MERPVLPVRVYRHALSGHSHRVELFLSLLGLSFETVDVDLGAGAHKSEAFRRMNPFGQVPVIEDGDTLLADSNAILVYLARRYDPTGRWYPADPIAEARVQSWLSVAAGPLAYGPGAARRAVVFGAPVDPQTHTASARLFGVLEETLADRDWLVAEHPTIADLAIYTYTAHAPEGGVSLEPYPAILAWLARIEALPGFVGMRRSPVGA